jgi:CubicO group peptidase (beta-lactamase class C family)
MDPDKLHLACEFNAQFAHTSSVAIIRHGWLVAEWLEISALTTTRYDVWSATKSFTGTAFGVLFEQSRQGRLPGGVTVDLDTLAYDHIPEGHPLTDPRKARIKLRHLLSMTSGVPGESTGIGAVPTETGVGPFEAALGFAPCKARRWPQPRQTATLTAEPGTRWDYSDPAMAHLALVFANLMGREMADVMQERVFGPIGIEHLMWDLQGVGTRFGPHTNAHTGIHVSAREMARFGYLMLRRGRWRDQQIVPEWWVEQSTRTSQELNPHYGFTWWVNTAGTLYPSLPRDAFAARGLHCNLCYVIPSLDLVVARLGSGPIQWTEGTFISRVVDAILDR